MVMEMLTFKDKASQKLQEGFEALEWGFRQRKRH